MASTGPAVLAVLVATDGASWLPEVLAHLEAQTYPHLDVLAVDNGSRDGSRDILLDRLSEDRVLVAERDLGFPGAVSMALDADASGDLVLLLHDDVALAPDAVEQLVAALVEDPRLAVVGPKLLDWEDPQQLQQVGWSVDITGRQDMDLERDERDQGQRDEPQRPLVVSSAGMLLRRDVFEALGRMDRRYHVFRDDLDVCWRAWLAGWEVGVIPAATGRHRRAAADYHRLGQSAFLGPRYFAERNTLATLLKNYGAARLAVVLPLFFLVGIAKVLGFVMTRQVGSAWQTMRAWAWNVVHLPGTLDLRRDVQRLRRRSDADLRQRFVRITPRVRAYAEAIADRLTGGDLRVADDAWHSTAEPLTVTARAVSTLRRHPVGWMAAGLVAIGLVVTVPLLMGGSLRGGTLAPFPESGHVFLEDYASSWHDAGAFGTSADPSPAQAMLGILQLLMLDSTYLVSRLLVLGAIPAAWVLSLRAIRPLTPTRGPRVAAATVYVLSPAALAAVRSGRVGALVMLVGLPAFVSAVATALGRRPAPATAWRAAAVATLAGAVIVAFEPVAALGVAATWVALGLWVAIRTDTTERRRRALARLGAIVFGTGAILFPWSLSLFQADSPVLGGMTRLGADPAPFWRWLLQAPEVAGYAGLVAGSGIVLAGVFGLLFAARRRAGTVTALWTVVVLGAVLATASSRAGGEAWVWPGVPLLLTSAALSALFAVGLHSAARALEVHDFGWRQVGAVAMVAGAVVGSLASLASLGEDRWSAYTVADPPLPAFISTVAMTDPDVRVLALMDTVGGVSWDVEAASGPTMAGFGTPQPDGVVRTVTGAIEDMVGGSDPGAAGRLGLLNIRYVVVPDDGRSEALERALAAQLDLEPRPVADGLVYEVTAWLPRVAFVPRTTVDAIARRGVPPTTMGADAFDRVGTATFRGEVDGRGAILVSETEVSAWHARLADGREVMATSSAGLVRIDVPADAGVVEVEHGGQSRRSLAVTLQVLAVLLVLSVMLRPPSFALEESR